MNGEVFAKKCMHEAGVAIVPGTAFGKTAVNVTKNIVTTIVVKKKFTLIELSKLGRSFGADCTVTEEHNPVIDETPFGEYRDRVIRSRSNGCLL